MRKWLRKNSLAVDVSFLIFPIEDFFSHFNFGGIT